MAAGSSYDSKAMKSLAQLVIKGDYGQVRQLATTELVKARDKGGRTVLMLAADADCTPEQFGKCTEYLLYLGADASAADAAGDTAAHLAARRDHLRLLALLPFEAKFLANQKRVTPLMEAGKKKKRKCAIHLLYLFRQQYRFQQKAKLLGMENSKRQTVLQIAKSSGRSALASIFQWEQYVLVSGEGLYNGGINSPEAAAQNQMKRLASAGDWAWLLRVATRVNCDLPDGMGRTALWWAAGSECNDTQRLQQLAAMADATCVDVRAVSCLHRAAQSGRAVAVRVLVAAGAPANARDCDGWTPLMLAAKEAPYDRAVAAAQALLSAGADWSLRNKFGQTALDLATARGCSEIADLLRGYEGTPFFDVPTELLPKPAPRCVPSAPPPRAQKPQLPPASSQGGAQALPSHGSSAIATARPKSPPPMAQNPQPPQPASSQVGAQALPSPGRSVTAAPVRPDRSYPVTDPQGLCLIININRYSAASGLSRRDGSEHDVARVCSLFRRLQFKIKTEEDLSGAEISRCMERAAEDQSRSDYGTFVCFLMAYGYNDIVCGSDGAEVRLKDLAVLFDANNCISLRRKPKIFFVQACRGERENEVVPDSVQSVQPALFCPNEADFLFSYANTEGYGSYRNPNTESSFIQTLCEVIDEDLEREHLVDIITEVNNRVTQQIFYCQGRQCHMVPDFVSRLGRKVWLDPSKSTL